MNKQTIMDEAKDEDKRSEAREYVSKAYSEDKELWQRAYDLVNVLGVGGLWRGIDLAMMHTIKALKHEKGDAE